MENKQLVSVRSNCTFALNYEDGKLKPQTEIVLVLQSPHYVVKKDKIVRDVKVDDFRFRTTLDGVNALIGELQLLVEQMNKFEQVSGSLNAILENAVKK